MRNMQKNNMALVLRILTKDMGQCFLIKVCGVFRLLCALQILIFVCGEDLAYTAASNQPQSMAGIPPFVPSAKPLIGSLLDFSPNCTTVTHIFGERGIPLSDIPQKPSNEMVLRYCESPSVGTCCTYGMETKMAMSSRLQLEKFSKEEINRISTVLGTKAHKFNDVFNQLLAKSKSEFHAMFKRTYGLIYEQNAYVFADLFTELEKYYSRGKVDLGEAMDGFFNTLFQKMFTVLNAQYVFDDKYLGCVSEHMKGLKPFGDVPDKLSVQIKRSFVATRTFAQALLTAAEVAKKMTNVRLNADCTAALTKMQHCGACKGYVEKPCVNYCVNVIKGCLHYLRELEMEWENFVSFMEKVSERLLGSFNIVMVVEPINIKISEAIMNFQDSGQDISNQIFQGCGKPLLGRKKRSVSLKLKEQTNKASLSENIELDILDIDAKIDDEIVLKESTQHNNKDKRSVESKVALSDQERSDHSSKGNGSSAGTGRSSNNNAKKSKKKQHNRNKEDNDYADREASLDKLIKEIRQKVKDSKKFWANLPYQVCNNLDMAASSDADNMCWNGHTVDRYMHSVTTEHGSSNPEFPGNPTTSKQQNVVASQLYYLKTATGHLKNAYVGQDVDWSDQEEPYYGSGSGSGAGIDDEDDNEEGSGIGPGSYPSSHKPTITNGNTEHPSITGNNVDNNDDEDDDKSDKGVLQNNPIPNRNGGSTNDGNGRNIDEDERENEDLQTHEPKFNGADRAIIIWSAFVCVIPIITVIGLKRQD